MDRVEFCDNCAYWSQLLVRCSLLRSKNPDYKCTDWTPGWKRKATAILCDVIDLDNGLCDGE